MVESIPFREFADRIRFDRFSLSAACRSAAVVVGPRGDEAPLDPEELTDLPLVVIGLGIAEDAVDDGFDCAVGDSADLEDLLGAIERQPLASVATALLLRSVHRRTVPESLVAESTTYSMLQSGPEFQNWCALNQSKRRSASKAGESPVLVERIPASSAMTTEDESSTMTSSLSDRGDHLVVTLNDPQRRNAYSATMRSALADALDVACLDTDVIMVTLTGAGTNFSSGGDLGEFGTLSDPVTAHVSRLTSSVAFKLWSLRKRLGANLICRVHGDNHGAGVELAAFAGHVVADRTTTFTLPEVGMGLTPGAGGTASLPARIGRQRTLFLALTGRTIDAATAHEWGLVDELVG